MRTLTQLIAYSPDRLADLFGLDAIPPSMPASLRQLAKDVAYLHANGHPPADTLDDAPMIDNWLPALSPIGVVLVGEVTGHPTCRGPITRTSPVWIIDRDFFWVRTLNRFYRLGVPAVDAWHSAH